MEKIDIIFKSNKGISLSFLEPNFLDSQNECYLYTPELDDNLVTSYSELHDLLIVEKEVFAVINAMDIDFFVKIKSGFKAHLDIYKKENDLSFMITCFIEAFDFGKQINVKGVLYNLYLQSLKFSNEHRFDEFYCKLDEDDEDLYFSHNGVGLLYLNLKDDSTNVIEDS